MSRSRVQVPAVPVPGDRHHPSLLDQDDEGQPLTFAAPGHAAIT